MLNVYNYAKCDTCRKAVRFLHAHAVTFREIPIRETPPTPTELRSMWKARDGETRRLFNTSGRDYKEQGLAEKLPRLTAEEALAVLAGNGNLIKRPFVIGDGVHLVGFDETVWREAFGVR